MKQWFETLDDRLWFSSDEMVHLAKAGCSVTGLDRNKQFITSSEMREKGGRKMTTPPMFCPPCEAEIIATPSRHGLVWLCRSCRSGAATLPILRQVAPHAFVNHL